MRDIKRRLRGRTGFSLVELIITALLVAILTALGAVGIGLAHKNRTDMKRLSDAQTLGSTALTVMSNELRFGRDIMYNEADPANIAAKNVIYLDSATQGDDSVMYLDADGKLVMRFVALAEDKARQLLGERAYTDSNLHLEPPDEGIFDPAEASGAIKIAINVVDSNGVVAWSGAIAVRPLNGIKKYT